MIKKVIGIILIIVSCLFVIGSITTLFKTKEKTSKEFKRGFESQGISASDTQTMALVNRTYIITRISSVFFLIIFIWVGYKGYKMCKTKSKPNKELSDVID